MNPFTNSVVILMVDDDPEDVFSTKRAFSEGKIANDFRHVSGGDELFSYLEHTGAYSGGADAPRPHIILLDINMPRKSGLDVLDELRRSEHFRNIPVVILTTSDSDRDILKSYDLGANSFVTKPVSIEGMVKVARDFENYWFQLVRLPNLG